MRKNGVVPVIRGVKYDSVNDAAMALGVTIYTVSQMIRSGKSDSIGLGRNCWSKVPVSINGVWFDSISSAERSSGIMLSGRIKRMRRDGENRVDYRGLTLEVLK